MTELIKVETEQWFVSLIEDCKDILTETGFTARWALVEGYHLLGSRILQEYNNFQRLRMDDSSLIATVATSLNKRPRTIYYAVQFARQYPDLNLLPEGKDTNWHQIVNKYLTEGKDKPIKPTVSSLMNMLKDIKKLLETERLMAFQEGQTSRVEFIRHLQDQFDKIVGGLEL